MSPTFILHDRPGAWGQKTPPLAQKLLNGTIRDGDTVEVRVSADGRDLNIKENHPADPEIGAAVSSVPMLPDDHEE